MGQPYTCDNGDGTLAFIVMTQPESGDTDALCAPCLLEWAYGLLTQSERGTELLKAKMTELLEAEKILARPAKAPARRDRAGGGAAKDTGGQAPPAADTPDAV